jgi:hypothetical protein
MQNSQKINKKLNKKEVVAKSQTANYKKENAYPVLQQHLALIYDLLMITI